MKPVYSTPKLVKYDDLSKTWYVYFRYQGKVIKNTKEINRIKNRKDRLIAGEALAKALLRKLETGWNPLVPDVIAEVSNEYTLYQAMVFAMEKKQPNIAEKTYSGYMCTLRFCKSAISNLSFGDLLISETRRSHIKLILEDIKKSRSWSNKAYNKGLYNIQAILSELLQWDVIEFSPAHKIKPLPVEETIANIPPSPAQHKKIKAILSDKHPEFYVFVLMIFHTGIRPVELTRIKIGMIDFDSREINLPASITKSRVKSRKVPINPFMWQYLAPILALTYPDDYYLFGSDRISGRGNEGLYVDFVPGPTQVKRDTATKRWEKIIKIGLGIPVNLYAMKHFGGDMKILAGMDIDAIKQLFGHSDKQTTEGYVKAIKQIYAKQINDLSPEF